MTLCNKNDQFETCFSGTLFARPLGGCLNPRLLESGYSTTHGNEIANVNA